MKKKVLIVFFTLSIAMLSQNAYSESVIYSPPYSGVTPFHDEAVPIDIGIGDVYTNHYTDTSMGTIVQIISAKTYLAGVKKIQALDSIHKIFSVATDGDYRITFSGNTSGEVYIVSSDIVGNAKGGGDANIEISIFGVDGSIVNAPPLYETARDIFEVYDDVKETYDELNDIINMNIGGVAETIINEMVGALQDANTPTWSWPNKAFSLTTTAYLQAGTNYAWNLSLISSVDSISALNACNVTGMRIDVNLNEVSITSLGVLDNPNIESFCASPATVSPLSSFVLSVEASDSDGQLSNAEFYLDTNGNSQLDVSIDQRVGIDTNYNLGFVYMGYADLTSGFHRYFARVQDDDGLWSSPASTILTVLDSSAIEGDNFEITNFRWDDNNAFHADHDHIMEAGEIVSLEIRLESDEVADNVYAVLSTNASDINITDSGVNYDDFSPGQSQWSSSRFDMDLNFDYRRSSDFTLYVTYEVNGQDYYQELPFSKFFYSQGELEPSFEVINVNVINLTN